MSKRTSFTAKDFFNGLSAEYLLGLIDDVKWRDSALKAIQYALKFNAATIRDFDLVADSKTLASNFDSAAGTISTARRCFRFLRWTRFVHNLPTDINQKDTLSVILKAVHHVSSICACIFEDITTLGRLKLLDTAFTSRFDVPGVCAWFSESLTGLIIQLRVIKAQADRFGAAKKEYIRLQTVDPEGAAAQKALCFQEYVKLHFAQVTLAKWFAETVAASHDMGYHSQTKAAFLSSFVSAVVSTYVQSAKFW